MFNLHTSLIISFFYNPHFEFFNVYEKKRGLAIAISTAERFVKEIYGEPDMQKLKF